MSEAKCANLIGQRLEPLSVDRVWTIGSVHRSKCVLLFAIIIHFIRLASVLMTY